MRLRWAAPRAANRRPQWRARRPQGKKQSRRAVAPRGLSTSPFWRGRQHRGAHVARVGVGRARAHCARGRGERRTNTPPSRNPPSPPRSSVLEPLLEQAAPLLDAAKDAAAPLIDAARPHVTAAADAADAHLEGLRPVHVAAAAAAAAALLAGAAGATFRKLTLLVALAAVGWMAVLKGGVGGVDDE